jgi:hypothetical protein
MNYYSIPGTLVASRLPKALMIVPEFPTGAGFPTKERNIDDEDSAQGRSWVTLQ